MTSRIPAVLLWTHDAPRPCTETYTAPAMCDSAEDAAAALRQGNPRWCVRRTCPRCWRNWGWNNRAEALTCPQGRRRLRERARGCIVGTLRTQCNRIHRVYDAPRPLPGQKSRGRHAHTGVEILPGVVLVSSAQTGRQGRALACCGAAVLGVPPRRGN